MNFNIFLISALIISILSNSPILTLAKTDTPCAPTMLSSTAKCKASSAPMPAPGHASFGPTSSFIDSEPSDYGGPNFSYPTTSPSQDPNDYPPGSDYGGDSAGSNYGGDSAGSDFGGDSEGSDNGGDSARSARPPSASLPSSSYSLKLSLLLFAFAFEIIKFF